MSKPLTYDKPMTKSQKCKKYKKKMKQWKDKNYLTFCFHLPKDLVKRGYSKTTCYRDDERLYKGEIKKMDWLKDKTYFFLKYNTLKLKKEMLEDTYIKEIKELMFKISDLEEEVKYYKDKYRLANNRVRKLKEKLKWFEEKAKK